jgi:urease accessory protein
MAEGRSSATLLRLMSWLSPAFPVGAFAYSHGLEQAIHEGLIRDRETLIDWLSDLIERGSGWNDAVLLAEAWRVESSGRDCVEVAELAEALAGSKERHMETTLQGRAFAEAVAAWRVESTKAEQHSHSTLPPSVLPDISPPSGEIKPAALISPIADVAGDAPSTRRVPLAGEMSGRTEAANVERPHVSPYSSPVAFPYAVAVGIAAARHGIPLGDTLAAFLHAFTSNLIQAAVRLVPLGQRDGVAALVALEPVVLAAAARAGDSTSDDLGSATFMSEIMSMKHEALYSRVFRS